MELDHATGAMEGSVRVGAFAGRSLEDLDPEELDALLDELSQDADSLALLTAWLERRASGPGPVPPPDPSSLSEEEALRILGLTAGATAAEIRAAHRRLMRKVHPDLGGTPALAAMINAARARLDPTQEDD
jgi:DnaJ-domain-containing protein 1